MKKLASVILIAVLILMTLPVEMERVSAESIDNLEKEIKELEKEKSKLDEENNKLEDKKKDTESKLGENKKQQSTVEQEINTIDDKLSKTQSEISTKENEITDTNNEIEELNNKINELSDRIEELKEEIQVLQDRIIKRDALLKERLRAIQQNGGEMKYMEVIFGASSFGDFISRTSAVNTIMDQDKDIMEAQAADKKALEGSKQEVEASKEEVETKKAAVVDKKKSLENQKQELVALKSQLNGQVAEKETLMASLEEEHGELEEHKMSVEEEQQILSNQATAAKLAMEQYEAKKSELEQLAKEEAARKKAAASSSSSNSNSSSKTKSSESTATAASSSGNGMFSLPTSGPITSQYSPSRMHPIFNVVKSHDGTDFGGSSGSPILAAADGVVSTAGVLSGFGNTVMITHVINGQTYTTLYAHLNSISVSAGQTVSQGQKIGGMGSTGNSTGTHLHFEVHPGGYDNPVNPMQYF